jgi:hypothetical protein
MSNMCRGGERRLERGDLRDPGIAPVFLFYFELSPIWTEFEMKLQDGRNARVAEMTALKRRRTTF